MSLATIFESQIAIHCWNIPLPLRSLRGWPGAAYSKSTSRMLSFLDGSQGNNSKRAMKQLEESMDLGIWSEKDFRNLHVLAVWGKNTISVRSQSGREKNYPDG